MALIDTSAVSLADVEVWRRDLHAHPELLFDVDRTAGFVAERLRAFGCDEVVTGIGRTGVVGIVHGRNGPGRTIALRADMDALPIIEATGLPYASTVSGHMHACGHDGHTAMLLGAVRELCATRRFAGTVAAVFQPAEEGGGGARVMIADGLLDRFSIAEVYGMHNLPGLALGHFAIRPGPIMAASDRFEIRVTGRGGHAAMPHLCADPVLAGAHMVVALQTIAARNVDPLDGCVLSVTQFSAGAAQNAIPEAARLAGTARALKPATRAMVEERTKTIVAGVASACDVTAEVIWTRGYPATVNDPERAAFCAGVAAEVAGPDHVNPAVEPMMGAEDFSFMLAERPGAFLFLGNGDSAGLHNSAYDFNDAALPFGIRYWVRLAERALPIGA